VVERLVTDPIEGVGFDHEETCRVHLPDGAIGPRSMTETGSESMTSLKWSLLLIQGLSPERSHIMFTGHRTLLYDDHCFIKTKSKAGHRDVPQSAGHACRTSLNLRTHLTRIKSDKSRTTADSTVTTVTPAGECFAGNFIRMYQADPLLTCQKCLF